MNNLNEARRSTDTWTGKLSFMWDWVDRRDIDKHAMSWAVFGITCYMLYWLMEFVWAHPDKPGLEIGAIIAAIMVPWTPVQAAVIRWYFQARSNGRTP